MNSFNFSHNLVSVPDTKTRFGLLITPEWPQFCELLVPAGFKIKCSYYSENQLNFKFEQLRPLWKRLGCSIVDLTPPNLGTGQCITIIDTPGTKDTEGEHKVSRNFH